MDTQLGFTAYYNYYDHKSHFLQIPSVRPQSRGKKAARGVPSKFASGGYTQTHGVISSSDLAMLKENRW